MKDIRLAAIVLAAFLIGSSACQKAPQDASAGHAHGPDTHVHPADSFAEESFTTYSKYCELFVEFPPLIVGEISRFAAHFTDVQTFKPVTDGKVIVQLLEGSQKILENGSPAPSSPGLFLPSLSPKKAGSFDLRFIVQTDAFNDTITVRGVEVYVDMATAAAAHPVLPEDDAISFSKEQAWKIDFATAPVALEDIHDVIRSSGEIQPVKGETKVVTARSSGMVFFRSKSIEPGLEVRSGEQLFAMSSSGLTRDNLEEAFKVAKARLERAEADYERAEGLAAKQIIGQKELEQCKMELEISKAEFGTLSVSYSQGGQTLRAPMSGIVRNVLVRDGQFVEEGTALLEISSNRRLILHADVSQRYLAQLDQIQTAHFRTPYQPEIQSIEDYRGTLISSGKVIEEGSGFIPVLFELDNTGELIPGAFVELFLLTTPIKNALIIPRSALMEEYGLYYVFVQLAGEKFERREVKLGVDDGRNVQILEGLKESERVVTRGAYQVKLASMSASIPGHGHEH